MKSLFLDSTVAEEWGKTIFEKFGVSSIDAAGISSALCLTSLWGIDSHGIARIPHYLTRYEAGSLNKKPNIRFHQTAAATGQINGDEGHGIVIMREATDHAVNLAKDAGVGIVGVQNSSHCGAIGLYTRQITEAGMVGIAFTHSDALAVPFGGRKAFFGTNPISIAFPVENTSEPICLDMATSIVPWNFIMNAKRDKIKVPIGYGVDKCGNDTDNADEIVAVKPMADHKGYALAFLIDMLCGPLNGMAFGPNITPMYHELDKKRSLGSLVIAIDPSKFGGKDSLRNTGTSIIEMLKLQGENILFPGQPEYQRKAKRLLSGIPISDSLSLDFLHWSEKAGITAPFYL